MDVGENIGSSFVIDNANGSYPVFEEIYKNFLRLGIDIEGIRRMNYGSDAYYSDIERKLNLKYKNNFGTEYVNLLNKYIGFFDSHGALKMIENENGESVYDVRKQVDATVKSVLN